MSPAGRDLARFSGRSLNAVAIIQSGLPWGVPDATTDFAGNGEITGNNAANADGEWDFFGTRPPLKPFTTSPTLLQFPQMFPAFPGSRAPKSSLLGQGADYGRASSISAH